MFILRNIADGHQSNTILGESYNLVEKESNPQEFTRAFDNWHGAIVPRDDDHSTYGFIIYEKGSKMYPLYKNQYNYIMISDGNTFANITFK